MGNRSHRNSGHMAMNYLAKTGNAHSSMREKVDAICKETRHCFVNADCLEVLRKLPDDSVQLIVCDPPYNIQIASKDYAA